MSLPIYVIAPEASRVRARARTLGGTVEAFDSLEAWGGPGEREPGVVLVDGEAADTESLLRLAAEMPEHEGSWTLGVVGGPEGGSVRSLAFGPTSELEDVARLAEDPHEGRDVLIDLQRTLAEIARVRHDVNNPLTAALAEVQLLLFDVEDEESRESLNITQTQLRRIRDLMASTSHLRPRAH